MPKLIVHIKHPEYGKGWRMMYPDCHPATEESHIIALTLASDPDITAIMIARQYVVPEKKA